MKMGLAAGALAVTGAVGVMGATPAAAYSGQAGWVLEGTAIRNCASYACGVQGVTIVSHSIPLQCYTDTREAWGTSYRWFKFYGMNSWVPASMVQQQPWLPHCP
jgi:hypothetical protein